ncbi:hypothetical protein NKI76_01590 [Mesorhizobium sp. M0435]
MTVGFVIDDIANPWHASCFKAVDAEMRQRGYSLYLMSTNGRATEEAAAIDMLQHGRADGMIMTINNEQDARTIKRLKELRIPSVLLDRDIPLEIDAVLTEHAAGLRQATSYLIELGHRRIAIITAGSDIRPGRERGARLRRGVPAQRPAGAAGPDPLAKPLGGLRFPRGHRPVPDEGASNRHHRRRQPHSGRRAARHPAARRAISR